MDRSEMLKTNFIWTPEWTAEDDADARLVYFRRAFEVAEENLPEQNVIRISADSRYKLYVNGTFMQEGPQKAMDLKSWFVDTVDIAPFLTEGENVIAVEVMRFPAANFSASRPRTNDSLLRTPVANLYVEDTNGSRDPRAPRDPSLVTVGGKSGWRCSVNREVTIVGENTRPAPIHVQEHVAATEKYAGWKTAGYDDSSWDTAKPYLFFDISLSDAPANLVPRTIPVQRHMEKTFEEALCLRDPAAAESHIDEKMKAMALAAGYSEAEACAVARVQNPMLPLLSDEPVLTAWNGLLKDGKVLEIPAHTKRIVEISAGAEECGYLEYAFCGGAGSSVETLCSEAYALPGKTDENRPEAPASPVKGDRTDFAHQTLFGHTSVYTVAGYGKGEAPEIYEPYWIRTFRFIRLTIETKDEPLTIRKFSYRETGYPLDVKTSFQISDPTFAPIWDISVRTLERCMHETYVDCPFYEQLQYAMDSRSEILYTYATSADDRLARQAMEAFRRSQRPDGMTNSVAPTVKSNVIPSFSIYYLMMVYDHMMYFGDKALVQDHLPAIDAILSHFERHRMENGLVGHLGGPLMRDRYWSFIDWTPQWKETAGVPTAINQGTRSLTMESLLYIYGLMHAAELCDFVGRQGMAEEYRKKAEELKQAVNASSWGTYTDENNVDHRLLQDGAGVNEFSVHTQVFGILTGLVSAEEGREMLHATVGNVALAQSSVSFMFYLFRAMEKCGIYEETDGLWDLWRQMLKNHLTTCVENGTDERSDCHAWASLMCYEMPAVMLGVRPAAPGFARVRIEPQAGKLSFASGDVVTPKGMVHVEWKKKEDGKLDLSYTLPEGMTAV